MGIIILDVKRAVLAPTLLNRQTMTYLPEAGTASRGEALHCRAPTLGSRRCPDTLHFVAGTGCARLLTDRSPVIIADGHKAHPYFEAKITASGPSVNKVEILVR